MVAGEPSGDLLGADLACALRERDPHLTLEGMGGMRMREMGVRLHVGAHRMGVVGLVELGSLLPALVRSFVRLVRLLRDSRPDLLLLIDFPEFNLLLARVASHYRIPVVYFVSPQVWAWRRGRIRTIRRHVSTMLVIFPFEESLYRDARVDVRFVGHPLLDRVTFPDSPLAARYHLGLPERERVIGLLPGSRRAEVTRHLPLMLAALERIRQVFPSLQGIVAAAEGVDREIFASAIRARGVPARVVVGETPTVMRAADLLVVASGTATLEAALCGTPMVIVYRLSSLSGLLARLLVRGVSHIGLPNLIAGHTIVPELIQSAVTPEQIASESLLLLLHPERVETMRAELTAVREKLGPPGAARRAAGEILALLARRSAGRRV